MEKYNTNHRKVLNRMELKKIKGGGDSVPGTPTGGTDINSACRRCCWNNTTTCSACVSVSSNATCVSGAYLTTSGCSSTC